MRTLAETIKSRFKGPLDIILDTQLCICAAQVGMPKTYTFGRTFAHSEGVFEWGRDTPSYAEFYDVDVSNDLVFEYEKLANQIADDLGDEDWLEGIGENAVPDQKAKALRAWLAQPVNLDSEYFGEWAAEFCSHISGCAPGFEIAHCFPTESRKALGFSFHGHGYGDYGEWPAVSFDGGMVRLNQLIGETGLPYRAVAEGSGPQWIPEEVSQRQ